MKLGQGIFMWDAIERRSNRYGYIYMSDVNYALDVKVTVEDYKTAINLLVGKKVKLWAVVLESRESGHLGDAFLGIVPTRPEVKEKVELGVGKLVVGVNYDGEATIGLKPSDRRKELWINPHKLYRLHDQTVELFVEETTEAETNMDTFGNFGDIKDGVIDNGDGTVQVKTAGDDHPDLKIKLPPTFTNIGDGCFIVEPQKSDKGVRMKAEIRHA